MELKKLIIHGFKSFADRVELTFEHGITGVVGPNGCGKSNISDAVRWVLGEQSAKSLRGAKMEDVIFNGTEKRRRQTFCEVALTFDNSDHTLPIDFAEVSVARRVYRSGEGEYSINGAPCRLKDVVDLFRDTGLGRDGYSVIGQGRIDEILSQKSEDRRQVFEEAAGIMKFKSRKIESERKLAGTSANLERVTDIITELEDRVEPLKKQSEEAREYLALRDELKKLDLNVFLNRSVRYEARINELRADLQNIDQEIIGAADQLNRNVEKRDNLQNELDQLEIETADKRESVQDLIRQNEELEGDVRLITERVASLEREEARLNAQRESAAGDGSGLKTQLDELALAISTGKDELIAAEKNYAEREAELTKAESELAAAEKESENLKSSIIAAMNRLSDVRSQEARLVTLKSTLSTQLAKLEDDIETSEEGMRAISEHADDAKDRLAEEKNALNELNDQARDIDKRVNETAEQAQLISRSLSSTRDKRQMSQSRLKLLKEMQRDYEGLNNSVKQVLMQARRLPNSGVHGVVADLIKVPERLERALDMVLGGALQNIVVNREEDAKRMIEYLRANRFGRATFLPISSVRGRTLSPIERNVLSMPGCVGLASELIEFDPQHQGVIDNLLGRTVIAEDLQTGIAIQRAGRHQFRLVTIDGDVMHSGGSMTGGSAQSRVTSLLSRAREIEQTEKMVVELDKLYQEDTDKLADIENTRSDLKRERGEIYDAVHSQEILCARAEELLRAAVEERARHEQLLIRLHSENARLQGQLDETENSLSSMTGVQDSEVQNTDDMRRRVQTLQGIIAEKRGVVEKARADVSELRVSFATKKHEQTTAENDRARLVDRMGNMKKLLTETQEQLAQNHIELAKQKTELEERKQSLASAGETLRNERESFNSADTKRVSIQRSVKELSEKIDTMRAESEKRSDSKHRAEMQLQKAEGDFKQIQDRIWDEYELTFAGAEAFRDESFKLTESERRIAQIRQRIREMGVVNVASVDEYRQTVQRLEELGAQRDDLNGAIDDLNRVIRELERNMERQFKSRFDIMNENFRRTFSKLFGGGMAELRLSDPSDALNCGIDIVAQPPGKRLQNLSLLSGGERALTAIAILFAMLEVKPTPFCILDEIEAALDDANIDNFADYLKDYSVRTQFVVITHRKGTMERCESLYGVVMEEKGVSKLVSVALDEAVG